MMQKTVPNNYNHFSIKIAYNNKQKTLHIWMNKKQGF